MAPLVEPQSAVQDSNMSWPEGRQLTPKITLGHIIIARPRTDIGKARPLPRKYLDVFGFSRAPLGGTESAAQDRIWASRRHWQVLTNYQLQPKLCQNGSQLMKKVAFFHRKRFESTHDSTLGCTHV